MAQQLQGGTTYTNTAPGNVVNATNLNALANAATLTNGAVIDQNLVSSRAGNTVTLAADTLLIGDSTNPDTAAPLKVPLSLLLLESQRNGTIQYAAGNSGGGGAAYVLSMTPATTAYNGGEVVRFKADAANTGAVTVNIDTIGVKSVVDRTGAALQANAIVSGQTCEIVYDAGNTYWVLMSAVPVNSVAAADLTESARDGVYQFQSATTTHSSGGGFDQYTVTLSPAPTGLIAGMRFRFLIPANNTQPGKIVVNYAVGNSGAISLVKGGTLALVNNDLVSGGIADVIYDGTNFQLTNPRGPDFISALTAIPAASGVATIAHGLGVIPSRVRVVLSKINGTADNGFAQNDELAIESVLASGSSALQAFAIVADATNITVARDSSNTGLGTHPKAGGGEVSITNANWNLKAYVSV